MLLAEDLLLLLTGGASGRLSVPAAQVDAGLGGANLLELTLMNKVDLSGEMDQGKPGRIIVRDPSPVGDAVLDAALEIIIAHQGKEPSAVITPLGRNLRRTLYERLAGRGLVRAERGSILGVFQTRRRPALDSRREEEVRGPMTRALVQQAEPDPRIAALIAVVHALRCEDKIVEAGHFDLSGRQLRARAGEVARGSWASRAVRTTTDEMIAAVVAATGAASAGWSAGSGWRGGLSGTLSAGMAWRRARAPGSGAAAWGAAVSA